MLKLKLHTHLIECGTDEAGRGCLAGPVTAAAVILPDNFKNTLLTDSKKLSEKNRDLLAPLIKEQAITFAISHVMMDDIKKLNILHASIEGMHRSIYTLSRKLKPEHILVDGNKFKPYPDIAHTCIIKGDGKYLSIAAASVLAKTARDQYMQKIHEEFPMYNWAKNKGYPTKEHRAAILKYGPCKYHRKGFKLIPDQLRLNLE